LGSHLSFQYNAKRHCPDNIDEELRVSGNRVDHVPMLHPDRSYIQLTEKSWIWKSNISLTKLSLESPPKNSKNFYLLRDFHGGTDGRVWLAFTESGKLAVVKFIERMMTPPWMIRMEQTKKLRVGRGVDSPMFL
jgi:hypothetical protein